MIMQKKGLSNDNGGAMVAPDAMMQKKGSFNDKGGVMVAVWLVFICLLASGFTVVRCDSLSDPIAIPLLNPSPPPPPPPPPVPPPPPSAPPYANPPPPPPPPPPASASASASAPSPSPSPSPSPAPAPAPSLVPHPLLSGSKPKTPPPTKPYHSQFHLQPPRAPDRYNRGQIAGITLMSIAGFLQILAVAFLVAKRRQALKQVDAHG